MTRFSSPEVARLCPAPQASTSTTSCPASRKRRADQSPITPAPITTIRCLAMASLVRGRGRACYLNGSLSAPYLNTGAHDDDVCGFETLQGLQGHGVRLGLPGGLLLHPQGDHRGPAGPA